MWRGVELLLAMVGTWVGVHLLISRRFPKLPKRSSGCVLLTLIILTVLVGVALGPITPSLRKARESAAMQTCRAIALAEFQYANDHGNRYPTGASSTEVFQKLIDGDYVSDPQTFFIPMPGKTPPRGNHLSPENVCYDVTADVEPDSPDGLPVVFITGFRVEYRPQGRAVSLVKPFPGCSEGPARGFDGLAVAYKRNNAWFRESWSPETISPLIGPDGFGIVSGVLPPDFDAAGKVYRQLTPYGILK